MDTNDMKKERVAGETIYYHESDDAKKGIRHLDKDLDANEVEPFLIAARATGQADFEDDHEGQYSLLYKKRKFILIVRDKQKRKGFFF